MNEDPVLKLGDFQVVHSKQELVRTLERLDLPENIIVTSGSAIKVNTVKKVLKELFPGKEFNVTGVKAASGINEQPVNDETALGAKNRITNAETLVEKNDTPRVFISIENGIFQVEGGEYEDKAVVAIKLPDGQIYSAVSPRGVVFPADAIEETIRKPGGFKDNTVGSIIAEMFATQGRIIDKQDPHSALTDNKFTREDQMISAIEETLKSIVQAIQSNN